jgi:recombination protein RecA
MSSALKIALEDLLRARRLQAEAPPLRGEDRRLSPLPTGVASIDALLRGGFPRGQVSEVFGPASSGRTGLVLSVVARSTGNGALAGWIDAADRFDPASAAAAGVDLARLLWLRGDDGPRALTDAVAAAATLVGSGLFEITILDLAGVPSHDIRRLPATTWIRLQRMVENAPPALLLLADAHVAHGPAGVSLALSPSGTRWSGNPGPGRLLRALGAEARAGRLAPRAASLELRAFD